MHMDPIMPVITFTALIVVLIGLGLQIIKQPLVVGYIIIGILIGPHGMALITDQKTMLRIGEIGVLLLLFFVGSEIPLKKLIANWRTSLIGTFFQILFSIICVWGIGYWLGWSVNRLILLGFVISLSSTAVVIKFLQDWGETDTPVGQDVIGILLVQDLAIIPMLIVIGLMGGEKIQTRDVILQIVGGIGVIALVAWMYRKEEIVIPFARRVRRDHEIQIFLALGFCFGLASLTAMLGLSTALGAFVAGMVVAALNATRWVHTTLNAFRVVFIAVFFVSIGMLINLEFVFKNVMVILLLSVAAILTNTFINAGSLAFLKIPWRRSLYAGSLLSQIGEFSFVLIAVGFQKQLINDFGYQLAVAIIAMTLIISPFWIAIIKRSTGQVQMPEH